MRKGNLNSGCFCWKHPEVLVELRSSWHLSSNIEMPKWKNNQPDLARNKSNLERIYFQYNLSELIIRKTNLE